MKWSFFLNKIPFIYSEGSSKCSSKVWSDAANQPNFAINDHTGQIYLLHCLRLLNLGQTFLPLLSIYCLRNNLYLFFQKSFGDSNYVYIFGKTF